MDDNKHVPMVHNLGYWPATWPALHLGLNIFIFYKNIYIQKKINVFLKLKNYNKSKSLCIYVIKSIKSYVR
jgi:hypothetical protein